MADELVKKASGEEEVVFEPEPEAASDVPIVAKVFVDVHYWPEGHMVEIPGLGTVPNKGSKQIDLTQAMLFEQATGQKWPMKGDKPQDLHFTIAPEGEEAK